MCLTFYAAEMARPKSHKFAIRTVGLTDEQAAALFYVFCSAARAAAGTENYETSCSVRLSVLNRVFPDAVWTKSSRAERVALVS